MGASPAVGAKFKMAYTTSRADAGSCLSPFLFSVLRHRHQSLSLARVHKQRELLATLSDGSAGAVHPFCGACFKWARERRGGRRKGKRVRVHRGADAGTEGPLEGPTLGSAGQRGERERRSGMVRGVRMREAERGRTAPTRAESRRSSSSSSCCTYFVDWQRSVVLW